MAYETKRLVSKGLEERSAIARSCSLWRIPRTSVCVAGGSGFVIGPIRGSIYDGVDKGKRITQCRNCLQFLHDPDRCRCLEIYASALQVSFLNGKSVAKGEKQTLIGRLLRHLSNIYRRLVWAPGTTSLNKEDETAELTWTGRGGARICSTVSIPHGRAEGSMVTSSSLPNQTLRHVEPLLCTG